MSTSKLGLFYALLSAENKGIQLVSLCKIVCQCRQRVAPLSGIMQIYELISGNDV